MNMQLSNIQATQILMEHEVFGTGGDAYDTCHTLVNYLEQLEEDIGEEVSLDPIAMRCEYSSGTVQDFREWYLLCDCTSDGDVLQYLEENTILIQVNKDLYIIQAF